MTDALEEVRRLAAERDERRRAKDFAAADALRDRIAELGYRVVDSPNGPALEHLPASAEGWGSRRLRPREVASALGDPATFDASVHWLVEGWPQDVRRALDAFRASQGDRSVQYVAADVTDLGPDAFGAGVEVVPLETGTGWAAARNAGLRRSLGRVVIVADGSVEPTGDAIGPLERALADPTVGVCGPFGIVTQDLREFASASRPEVDAIEGYLMAFRRETLASVGLFDERFKWYRTADIELSFRVKDAGLRAVAVDLPMTKHEHRMWTNTPPAERDRLSKRNYYRFLERFRGRFDLLVAGGERSD